jgi:putative DNA-invertase from lambdoid prophage Rac
VGELIMGRPRGRPRTSPLTSTGRPRAVSYHRVSTRDQDPTLAKLHLQGFARGRAFDLVDEIEETGSGARGDRPGLARVLELARAGSIAYVLVWKLDRIGRSTIDVLGTVEELERCGVTLIATSQGLEVGPGDSAIGRMVLRVLAAVAELERDMISERTHLGLEAARRRGVKLGRPRKWKEGTA